MRLRPYQLNPDVPAEGVDRRAYYSQKFPNAERLAKAREAIKENATASGFTFDPAAPSRLPNTLKAHQVIRLAQAKARAEPVALALYRAFWDDCQDIGDDETLIDIAGVAGLPPAEVAAALSSSEDAAAVAAEAEMFRRIGVAGVPTFIVNERNGFSGGMPPEQLGLALKQAAAKVGYGT